MKKYTTRCYGVIEGSPEMDLVSFDDAEDAKKHIEEKYNNVKDQHDGEDIFVEKYDDGSWSFANYDDNTTYAMDIVETDKLWKNQ